MTTHERNLTNRRQALVSSAALATWIVSGCSRPDTETAEVASTPRSKVPLRVTLVGDSDDDAKIARGWDAVAEHPLEITVIPLDRLQGSELAQAVCNKAATSDVLILPLSLVSETTQRGLIVPLTGVEFDDADVQLGAIASAARNGAARYGGSVHSIPLGAAQPFLLSGDESEYSVNNWSDYDQLVERWDGIAAEPIAPGWAASMFLWRASGERDWLFGRDDLEPRVDAESYVRSLEQMVKTCRRYKGDSYTPQQVWDGVASGQLRGGIGYPELRANAGDVAVIRELPGATEASRVLLDPFTPVAALAASCRQSSLAKSFMIWLSGGEGSESVRRQVRNMTETRVDSTRANGSLGDAASVYDNLLLDRLSTPVTMPTIQLLEAGEFYRALDVQVIRALREEAPPAEALAQVVEEWRAILRNSGIEDQRKVWRQVQGMRG